MALIINNYYDDDEKNFPVFRLCFPQAANTTQGSYVPMSFSSNDAFDFEIMRAPCALSISYMVLMCDDVDLTSVALDYTLKVTVVAGAVITTHSFIGVIGGARTKAIAPTPILLVKNDEFYCDIRKNFTAAGNEEVGVVFYARKTGQ